MAQQAMVRVRVRVDTVVRVRVWARVQVDTHPSRFAEWTPRPTCAAKHQTWRLRIILTHVGLTVHGAAPSRRSSAMTRAQKSTRSPVYLGSLSWYSPIAQHQGIH